MVQATTTDGFEHQHRFVMRKLVILFTGLIVLLSLAASLAGALSYGHDRYRAFTTARGETVEVALCASFGWAGTSARPTLPEPDRILRS